MIEPPELRTERLLLRPFRLDSATPLQLNPLAFQE